MWQVALTAVSVGSGELLEIPAKRRASVCDLGDFHIPPAVTPAAAARLTLRAVSAIEVTCASISRSTIDGRRGRSLATPDAASGRTHSRDASPSNRSGWLDVRILAKTPFALFGGTYKGDIGG